MPQVMGGYWNFSVAPDVAFMTSGNPIAAIYPIAALVISLNLLHVGKGNRLGQPVEVHARSQA